MKRPSPEVLDRLAKLAGMFGSEHLGERASAAKMAHELVVKLGLTWADLLVPAALPIVRMHPVPGSGHGHGMKPANVGARHQYQARMMLLRPRAFSEFERAVLQTVSNSRTISDKQRDILRQCQEKYAPIRAAREMAI